MKRDVFTTVAMIVLIALMLVMIIVVVIGTPTNSGRKINNTGNETLVLEIVNLTQNYYYTMPAYYVRVVYSNDSAIEEGANYYMEIDAQMAGYFGASIVTPKELSDGSVIGIDYYDVVNIDKLPYLDLLYYVYNGTITVWVEADPFDKNAWDNAWRQKIRVIG